MGVSNWRGMSGSSGGSSNWGKGVLGALERFVDGGAGQR